ncbi:hypothetical protein IAR55_003699 [Kwoniella newhampshirensis]|uniref:DUF1275 domain protein n=1 Tax=Kwoniella newhampshirensis TaxID=1651941 RepID=A0AAW0YNE4_9TREE
MEGQNGERGEVLPSNADEHLLILSLTLALDPLVQHHVSYSAIDSTYDEPQSYTSTRRVGMKTIHAVLSSVSEWIGDTGVDLNLNWRLWREPVSRRPTRPDEDGIVHEDEHRFGRWNKQTLSGNALVVPLFFLTFSSALADSVTLRSYNTFATSMTGNTVLLAMAVVGTATRSPVYAGVSLFGFVGAGLVFGQIGNLCGHRRRSWLLINLSIQLAILVIATLLSSVFAKTPIGVKGRHDWVYLLLFGLQGGIQVTLAANSGCRELPTAMMTTPYAALISDPTLFSSGSGKDVSARNRRFVYVVLFWVGCFTGAGIAKWSSVWVMTVVVIGCKLLAVAFVILARGDDHGIDKWKTSISWDDRVRNRQGSTSRQEGGGGKSTTVFRRLSLQKPRDEQSVAM